MSFAMASPTPESTTGRLNFFIAPPAGVRAYLNINADPKTGIQDTNGSYAEHEVVIENLRGKEDSATLDTAGFQLYHRPSKHTAFTDDAEIEREYYPESIETIKELTGASRVVLFDHTIRRRRPGQADDSPQRRQPVAQTHVDQTHTSSIARVHRHLPASDVPELLRHRFQIINLWRPISRPALDWPLTLCDYRTVDPKTDTAPVALIYPDREGETLGVKYNPNQKWKYFYGMTPEEIILIKCFDSIQDGSVAVFTPHTGFEDPATPAGTPPRESIELRALVFYD
ncbi:Uncharacterized protein in dcmA 3'region [Hypsizygus marmoreus]|uniref:Uncharacterized protein in dcmA 3'region n=1 Tax=Hypsizygus marmoreus TaxID=39966 RepID=A0A369K887_HYPMA|nr:Uncharacterized protein in dcmA 3'region [Hypsizygus marmoreus]